MSTTLERSERKWLADWLNSSHVGMSARSLVTHALNGEPPTWEPLDHGDLGRCEWAYAHAPETMQERMLPVLEQWRDMIWTKRPHRACWKCNQFGRKGGVVADMAANKWVTCPECNGMGYLNRAGKPVPR